ncbi:Tim17/Tim22/Tim23/Pmp24 family-domain-containing protein [Microdochium trichocladiopsis]|uniref:Mitochondrial import inner membrane translocase subunit TIM22 n=1 Tax=Microdochium trichocladiopsis TaxID=1682393 RepID=A0A9P8Y6G0_9PEZI|nr:Tim17/Tim22/Tim23/Pmp24 family-domain-containing protein [Microdochium trichocladiopsis]KAH7032985.1 Tim17/Tim22/Tim23/Pmp24 family-domain-containing protein [Microdochium trichocladiopsis]
MSGLGDLGANAAAGVTGAGHDPNDPNVKAMQAMMESCFGKSAISGVMGFGMGGLFGLFMASMSYDTPFHGAAGATSGTGGPGGAAKPYTELPMRQQIKIGFKDMGNRAWSSARNFGKVGALYSGIECGVEGFRAKNDLTNSVAAGCLTGGVLARGGGPTAVAGGCAAFAAFSTAIDAYMRSPPKEDV